MASLQLASTLKPLVRWCVSTWLRIVSSILIMTAVSMVLLVPMFVPGPRSMDFTFDIVETPAANGVRDGSAVYGRDADTGIECSDASLQRNDGKWWIRCKFIAEQSGYARDYLESKGLELGNTRANVMIRPLGGGWLYYLVAAVLVLALGAAWRGRDRTRVRKELQWIAQHRWGSAVAVLLPMLVTLGTLTVVSLAWPGAIATQTTSFLDSTYWFTLFMTMVVVAPVLEELLYRGVIYDLLHPNLGALGASGVGTLLFVAAHAGAEFWNLQPLRLMSLAIGSLALYAVRVRCNSLLLCIVGHALLNFVVFYAYSFGQPG